MRAGGRAALGVGFSMSLSPILLDIYETGEVELGGGRRVAVHAEVSRSNVEGLRRAVLQKTPRNVLEIGMAHGISSGIPEAPLAYHGAGGIPRHGPRHVGPRAGQPPRALRHHRPFVGPAECSMSSLRLTSCVFTLACRRDLLKKPSRTHQPRIPFRTTAIGRGENGPLWRGRARHLGVSAWGSPRRSPKTPRNGGKPAADSRSGRGISGVADYMAERVGFEPTVGCNPRCGGGQTSGGG